ncbi:DEAD/DEAH box helicase family protein [uncultured Psychrobacter sp.]|uniref:DEAD/DEAH box helicase family protein n=1 Tax=uncultured Psychrobacter sp. TaxID=259303 RepID=UPI00345AB10C
MIDFKKRLHKKEIVKKTNPIEIYESLDRRSIAGPLRIAQSKILSEWYNARKDEKDLIIKLHTGEGKTLIGLMVLQSKINFNEGPCLYICPNKYLVEQVKSDAEKFGISYCSIGQDNTLPNEFLDGRKILITHVQKAFNGKTIFGLDNDFVPVKNIILDDSHACIESIRNTFAININSDHPVYKELLELFKDSLSEQGEGTFLEIESGEYNSFLPIPYWSWIDKSNEVLKILSNYRSKREITFSWPFIKDSIKNCEAFISGNNLEISPIHIPIERFSFFHNANQRILMSATTQDDSFFIKGLGFNPQAVESPLDNPEQIWSGEKMIVLPSLINESLDRADIINKLAKPFDKDFGIVSLVPSFEKSKIYDSLGSVVPESNEIVDTIEGLKRGYFKDTVVFANRYDGIDLPDETCRVLILDGRPFTNSLSEKYEESIRVNSDSINVKIAQKIEQGLGRSVRGEKDYCFILIIGADLVKFVKSSLTNKYFSPQTKKQIDIGMGIAQLVSDDLSNNNETWNIVKSLMKQSLERDEGWKEYYKEAMNETQTVVIKSKICDVFTLERKAAVYNYSGNYERASELIQEVIDKYCEDGSEKGWYLQLMARYKYLLSKIDSNSLQKSAFLMNNELLKPNEGITYKKLNFINENRNKRISEWVSSHSNYEEMNLSVSSILSDLEFGTTAEKFELALKELGLMLGFLSERPDKEFKKGPDNLWCGVGNQYFIFECKNEVNLERKEVNKHEVGQMNSHCAWFESQYNDSPVKRVLIIPTRQVSYHADFTHEVEIMKRWNLKKLRNNVKGFFKEFNKYKLDSLTNEKIQEFINAHNLDVDCLLNEYSEKYHKNTFQN